MQMMTIKKYQETSQDSRMNLIGEASRLKSSLTGQKPANLKKYWNAHPEAYQAYVADQKALPDILMKIRINALSEFDLLAKKRVRKSVLGRLFV